MRLEACEMGEADAMCPWCGRGIKVIHHYYDDDLIGEKDSKCPWVRCKKEITVIQYIETSIVPRRIK